MKKILTKKYKDFINKESDLIEHPPVFEEEEDDLIFDKKKKYIYQLNKVIDDIDIEVER
jgi:hypothetical protein